MRTLITEVTRDLNHRGVALNYEDQLKFVSNRFLTLHRPIRVMKAFGGAETDTVPGGVSISDFWDTDTRAPPEDKTRRLATCIEAPPHVELVPHGPSPEVASSALRLTRRVLHVRGMAALSALALLRDDPNLHATRAAHISTSTSVVRSSADTAFCRRERGATSQGRQERWMRLES